MNHLSQRLAALSPEQRALLEKRLQQRGLQSPISVAITRHSSNAVVPLSFDQQRLYFFEQLVPGSALYNMPLAIRLAGTLNLRVLEQSLQAIAQRHEILRTQFVSQAGQAVQVVQSTVDLTIAVVDLQDLAIAEQTDAVQRHLIETTQQPFEISQAPLLRLRLLRLNPMEHVLVCVLHHLIADGWSRGVLIQELETLYSAGVTGQAASLPELPIQYGDFALWQQQHSHSPVFKQHLQYWQQQLIDPLPVLELPNDFPRPLAQSFRGAKQTVQLPLALTNALKALSQQEGATLFMTLLAGFKALLSAYTGQIDIVVGTDIANRQRPEIEGLIGFFVNQLVLRTNVSLELTFRQLLQRVREVTLSAYSHQDVPFEQLVATLNPDRDLSRSPLFQVKFVLQNVPTPDWQLPGLQVEVLPDIDTGTTALDLFLSLTETSQGLSGSLEYNTDIFTATTIQRFLAHFQQLLIDAVANPDQPLQSLCLLTPGEKAQLQAWNQTEVDYRFDRCLQHWIEDQVERTPDAIAVIFGNTQLTYRELNQSANQLANHLQQLGVEPDTLVGICVERSLEMVIGLLGILKAGGAYVPLDPSYPPERLAFMVQDTQVPILLTQQSLLKSLPPTTAQILCLDTNWQSIQAYPSENPKNTNQNSSSLAYVIYTSGSTGKPKGAMNTHQGICNRLLWMQDAYSLTANDRVLQKTPFSFDVSVWELFWPLMAGASLVVAPPDAHRDSAELVRLIMQYQITTLHFVPSMLRVFLNDPGVVDCVSLRRVICSGEALSVDLPQLFFQRLTAELHNLYGPTEAAVDVTAWECQRNWSDRPIPIGYPIANTQIYILNSYLQPVPIGVAGELHIGGVGVGQGYLNRPELTAEKFISSPFSNDDGRLYKTGDLARYRPDGSVEYLGRLDHQVKLRGLRIELGEIEVVLTQHPAVREAVVIAREDQFGQLQLIAYWVASPIAEAETDQLRSHLLTSLPGYMVPAQFIRLEALPTLPNGKLNRRALPAPTWEAKVSTFVSPRTPVEQRLCQIWAKYLQCDGLRPVGDHRVGIHDSFFELGGHSLLATQVISEIRQVFEIELPLRCLFESPTVAGLAVQVNQALATASTSIPSMPALQPVPRSQSLPLSFAQQRLWFLQQLEPDAPLYNGAALVRLQGTLHSFALEQSLQEIVQRHETLRTQFVMVEGKLVQQILPQMAITLPVVDLSDLAEPKQSQQVQTLASKAAQHSFDLKTGPLLRVSLLRLSPTDHCLLLNLHHIISDGWSIGVLVRELAALYPAFVQGQISPLPALPIQYADYAVWQRQWLQGEVLQTQLNYWKEQLSTQPPILVFPSEATTDAHTHPNTGSQYKFTLSAELTTALKYVSQQQNVTLFMTLLATFNLLLFDLTGTTDLLVGSPIANRNRPEIENLIGFFVNTLVLRTDLSGDPSFAELLQRVRQVALGAYAHQDLPFEQLVSELQPNRSLTQAPFFRVWFVLQNAPMPPLELPELALDVTDLETGLVRHDLKLDLTETGDQLSGFFEYKTAIFDMELIAHLHSRYEQILQQVTTDPNLQLSQIQQHLQQLDQQQQQAQATAFQANQRQRLSRFNRCPSLHNPA